MSLHDESSQRTWVPWVVGIVIGALLMLSIPVGQAALTALGVRSGEHAKSPPKPDGEAAEGNPDGDKAVPVTGQAYATIKDFGFQDPEGHRVLSIAKLKAEVNVDALREQRLHMPSGTAEGIKLVIRRGKTGRVSLSEAFHGGAPPSPAEARKEATQAGMLLDIGPLEATDIRLRIEMGSTPVVMHLRKAQLRVERTHQGEAPRIFLSNIQGQMVSPDPLPKPIEIHDGGGVVNLESGPLVDLAVRVCVSNGEMRLKVDVPERMPDTTQLIADGDRFMGVASAGVLNVVDWFKDSIHVENGTVKVPGERYCDGDERNAKGG